MSKKKVVLEEEKYVEALERIIERDFFPDLSRLRQHSQLASCVSDASGHRVRNADCTARGHPAHALRVRSPLSMGRSGGSSWDQPTPARSGSDELAEVCEDKNTSTDDTPAVEEMTLNSFVATHTSEDNAAFTELQEQSIESHRSRYHWAYDTDRANGDPKLHLLSNGKWISVEERQIVDQVLAPKGPKDERPSAPETWPFRARNALLFVPDNETSTQTSKVDTKLLRDTEDSIKSRMMIRNTSPNEGVRPRAKRETVYANSRFETIVTEKAIDPKTVPPSTRDMGLLQMTPMIAPGVDASPLMTWGDIEHTPIILGSEAPQDHTMSRPSFVVKENSTREQTAFRLESQARIRKTQSRQRTPTPLIVRGKRPSESATPTRADGIRSRISSVRSSHRTPLFGPNFELRASYSTPARPTRHIESKKSRK